jgi:hypothetical protein
MYTVKSGKNPDRFVDATNLETSTLDCRHCGHSWQGDSATCGARCPRCREPLYERTDPVRRQKDAQQSRGGVCAVHPGNVAVGPCKRCGTFMCGICRSRWTERALCVACVERLIGNDDESSAALPAHRRQALVSVLLGFAGWILALPLAMVRGAGASPEAFVFLVFLAAISLVPSLFGLGQAAAAIRVRGDRMVLATCGLALTGIQIGTVTGLVLLVIWKQ